MAALFQQGRFTDAFKLAEKGVKLAKDKFGPGDFFVTIFTNNLESIRKQIAREEEALVQEEQVDEDWENVWDWPEDEEKSLSRPALVIRLAVVWAIVLILFSWPFGLNLNTLNTSKLLASTQQDVSNEQAPIPTYQVTANFNPQERSIQGEEEVSFQQTDYKPEMLFDLYLNRYQDDSLSSSEMRQYAYKHGVDKGNIEISQVLYQGKQIAYSVEGELLRIPISREQFVLGQQQLRITFKVKIPMIADRVGGNNEGIWLGNWLPTLTYNQQILKPTEVGDPFVNYSSTYNVSFTVPMEYNLVLSNQTQVQSQGDNKIYTAHLEKVRDLPVFLNQSYKVAELTDGPVDIHFYYLTGGHQAEVLQTAKQALDFYRVNVGDYPWNQLNIVENDMYLSGMEYSTMLLVSSKALNTNLAPTVFHEVGHQWFYNIIGSDQYHAAYLDEGAVEFFTTTILNGKDSADHLPVSGLDKDISQFTNWKSYREVDYTGGEQLFENLQVLMGKDKFNSFIKDYYNHYRFSLVTGEQFKQFVDSQIGTKVTQHLFNLGN